MKRIVAFVRERAAIGDGKPSMIEGGASFAYVFGKVLAFLLLVEALTGAALAAFYSPSTTDAWASVAYIQDQSAWGWVVRGLHHHGGAAIVIIAGLHLVQTAVAGAYKRPRELVWWFGVLLLVLLLAWSVTGYVLRWDQEGYWANRVELGIAAGTPLVGDKLREVALGGNDYGNLTLTRFYALHVIVMPAVVLLATVAHIWLARKHGTTPMRTRSAAPRWPDQWLRDALAMAVTLAIMLVYVVSQHGAHLAAPADPSQAYDARPLWYFRWLFELRELAGSAETIAALAAPAILGGYLVALPLLDKGPDRAPRARLGWLGGLMGLFAVVGALTVMSFARDGRDPELADRQTVAAERAARARKLAQLNGVPVTGAQDVFATAPMWKARTIFAQKCSGCHVDPKERKGPVIGPGHGNRAWIKAFLQNPSGDEFWGRTDFVARSKIARAREDQETKRKEEEERANKDKKPDPKQAGSGSAAGSGSEEPPKPTEPLAMEAVPFKGQELDELVEFVYSQSGAADVDKAKATAGAKHFESCTDCHQIDESVAGSAGPNLHGLGTREYYTSFVGNPKAAIHMTEPLSQMPRFDKELTLIERDLMAEYLVWLRSASAADLEALGPL